MRARAIMHARAQIDEALRPFDQRCQDIGRERVDGEHMRQAVAGDAMTFLEADGGIVNDRIESAERVDLASDVLGGGDRRQIADDDGFGLGRGLPGVRRPGVVARMQDGLMALIGEMAANHQTEAVGRTRDENARHAILRMLQL